MIVKNRCNHDGDVRIGLRDGDIEMYTPYSISKISMPDYYGPNTPRSVRLITGSNKSDAWWVSEDVLSLYKPPKQKPSWL